MASSLRLNTRRLFCDALSEIMYRPGQRLFFPSPAVKPVGNGLWELVEAYKFNGFTIPRGFRTDFDSIPRLPVIFAAFKGRTRAAALVHDYLYTIGFDRYEADRTFLRMMVAEGVRLRHAFPIYLGVRLFGWLFHGPKKKPLSP